MSGARLKRLEDAVADLARSTAGYVDMVRQLERALHFDLLTGARSRLYFFDALHQELGRFRRERRLPGGAHPFAVAMLDVDHFKAINDFHGHAAGDLALTRLTDEALRVLRRRDLDIFARLSGDEFALLLPHTTLAGAMVIAERLRAAIAEVMPTVMAPLTVSIGVAACPEHGETAEALLSAADAALYRAKRSRDCVVGAG